MYELSISFVCLIIGYYRWVNTVYEISIRFVCMIIGYYWWVNTVMYKVDQPFTINYFFFIL